MLVSIEYSYTGSMVIIAGDQDLCHYSSAQI